jgi:hypothetical protein
VNASTRAVWLSRALLAITAVVCVVVLALVDGRLPILAFALAVFVVPNFRTAIGWAVGATALALLAIWLIGLAWERTHGL